MSHRPPDHPDLDLPLSPERLLPVLSPDRRCRQTLATTGDRAAMDVGPQAAAAALPGLASSATARTSAGPTSCHDAMTTAAQRVGPPSARYPATAGDPLSRRGALTGGQDKQRRRWVQRTRQAGRPAGTTGARP